MSWVTYVLGCLLLLGTVGGVAPHHADIRPADAAQAPALLDETFSTNYTSMPLQAGVLYLDTDGYEMFNAVTNPKVVVARPRTLRPLGAYTVLANLTNVRGPDTAPYGIDLFTGTSHYAVEIRADGRYSVQLLSGSRRTPLIGWTWSAQISRGHVANELTIEYAASMLQLFINGVAVGWVTVPDSLQSVRIGLINEGSTKDDTLVRCTHFQVRQGPVSVLDDRFPHNGGRWPTSPGTKDLAADGYHLQQASTEPTSLVAFPGAVAPTDGFAVSADLRQVGGERGQAFGLQFLTTGGRGESYAFMIDEVGRYALLHYQGRWSKLIDWTALPILRQGTASNQLYAHYANGILILGANGTIIRTLTLSTPPVVGQVGLIVNPGVHVRCTHVRLAQPLDGAGANPLQPAPALPVDHVVLDDSFADNRNRWYTDSSDFVADHTYHVQNSTASVAYRGWAQKLQLATAYSVAATVQLIDGSPLNAGYGLVFLDHSSSKGWELYIFEISGNGYYSLWRAHMGVWTLVLPWTRTSLVAQGYSANRVRVDVLNAVVSLYINGQHVTDTALPARVPGPSTVGFAALARTVHIVVRQAQVTTLRGGTVPVVMTPVSPSAQPTPARTRDQTALRHSVPAVVRIVVTSKSGAASGSSGTGFVVRSDKTAMYVVTAGHVIANVNPTMVKQRVSVIMQDGRALPAGAVAFRPGRGDVAVIQVPLPTGLSPAVASFGSSSRVEIGDKAWAIGYYGNANPAGASGGIGLRSAGLEDMPLTQPGEVSNLRVRNGRFTYLTTSATLVEGMSGGPLVFVGTRDNPDLLGRVIGINDAYLTAVRPGGQSPNLNLVLPSDSALPLINDLLTDLHAHG